jgi:hypothetical protein
MLNGKVPEAIRFASLAAVMSSLCVSGCAAQTSLTGLDHFRQSLFEVAATRVDQQGIQQFGIPFISVRVDGRCTTTPLPPGPPTPASPQMVIARPDEAQTRFEPLGAEAQSPNQTDDLTLEIDNSISLEERNINAWMVQIGVLSDLSRVDYQSDPPQWTNDNGITPSPQQLWRSVQCQRQSDPARLLTPSEWGINRQYISSFHIDFITDGRRFSSYGSGAPPGFSTVFRSGRCVVIRRTQAGRDQESIGFGLTLWQDLAIGIYVNPSDVRRIGSPEQPLADGDMCALRARAFILQFDQLAQKTDEELLTLVPENSIISPSIYIRNIENYGVQVDRRISVLRALIELSDLIASDYVRSERRSHNNFRSYFESSSRVDEIIRQNCSYVLIHTPAIGSCNISVRNDQ